MTEAKSHYAKAGVDIDAGQQAVNLMKGAVRKTYTNAVLSDTGNFGGLFAVDSFKSMLRPILVASTDGVGTKTKVAAALNRWDTIGQDLVNHCINDILVQGARPLFFLDYVASSKLIPEQIAAIVTGMAAACQQAGCALLGGETAEMPGVYEPNEVDVVGTVIGVVDQPHLIDGKQIQAGDTIIGLPSSGLHTNGYSLARAALAHLDWENIHPLLNQRIGDALLAVHRSYLPAIELLRAANIDIRGLAHITGGGIVDNLPRILPDTVSAVIRRSAWDIPAIFSLIETSGSIDHNEMYRVFNMGMGMLIVLPSQQADHALAALSHETVIVGEIVSGNGSVIFED